MAGEEFRTRHDHQNQADAEDAAQRQGTDARRQAGRDGQSQHIGDTDISAGEQCSGDEAERRSLEPGDLALSQQAEIVARLCVGHVPPRII